MPEAVPYGSWRSPITAELAAGHDGRPTWISHDGTFVWWAQSLPVEGGRVTLMRRRWRPGPRGDDHPGERAEVVLPSPWSARSRVHEYGGRPYLVISDDHDAGASVVFSDFSDQRLYRFFPDADGKPEPISPRPDRPAGWRYVEPVLSPDRRDVWCIREEHTGPASTDIERAVVAVPLDGSAIDDPGAVRVLVADDHFLACPRLSPDGRWLSWIGWNHPDMPWDSTRLRVAPVTAAGSVGPPTTVAGGSAEAVVQAEWESTDSLLLVTDSTGWWNLHRVRLDGEGRVTAPPTNVCPLDEEFGGALWQLGMTWFVLLPGGRAGVIHGCSSTRLSVLHTGTGELIRVESDHTEWAPTLAVVDSTVIGVAGRPDRPYEIVAASSSDHGAVMVGTDVTTGEYASVAAALPSPVALTFTGPAGREIHTSLYPPRGQDVQAPPDELPPYVIFVHGGPTSRAPMVYDLEIAYFTSRGIGVVEVNYGGSTGYGREYRERLRENWGIVDVDDCVAVARGLAMTGTADPSRLAIRGGSAGGWTSAAALASSDVFACGVIHYPILDLVGWRTGETHDFESQYLESLVGPWPEAARRYHERSPINHTHRFTVPFLLLQGLEDEICPPVQCERFVQRIAGRGVPYAYLTFAGEQHGFRRRETMVTALRAELALYARVFRFTPADEVMPLGLTW